MPKSYTDDVIHIQSSDQRVIVSTLCELCHDCLSNLENRQELQYKCPVYGMKRRRGISISNGEKVILCSEKEPLIQSKRIFADQISGLRSFISTFDESISTMTKVVMKDTKRLIHNLTTINAHNIQEFSALLPLDYQDLSPHSQITRLTDLVKQNPEKIAKLIFRMAKHNAAMKVEFSVFKNLFDENPILQPRKHAINKVVLNVFYTFFPDFTDKGIRVQVDECKEYLVFDFESVHVAFFHIIDNASKYILPNSYLNVGFSRNDTTATFDVSFNMISVKIEEFEVDKIFEESYSGINTKKIGRNGDGLGLSIVKNILQKNNIGIEVNANVNKADTRYYDGLKYENNIFIIKFPL